MFSQPAICAGAAASCQSVAPQLIAASGVVVTTNSVASVSGPAIMTSGGGPTPAEILSAFECPVCMDYMVPPYLQCQSGHLLCSTCRPKVSCCPSCRGPVRK